MEQLDTGLRGKLTLICAPAGFGKTTLMSDWVARCERPFAWLSLDVGEGDLSRFLTYLIAALQTVDRNLGGEALASRQSPQPPSTEATLTLLLNDIAALSDPFILILDDYHAVDSEEVDAALGFLLEHLPPQLHVVVATREDPQLPLARWRARGELSELRAHDLRFTADETAAFFAQVMEIDLSKDDIAALESRTEGWVAGLQLAALSVQGRANVPAFIETFAGSNRYIVDYLVEEVLERQSEDVRRFLLQTSVLERLSAPLCDAVTQQEGSQVLLETLERGNLFLIPLDDERRWYRYHHLFADVLRARLLAQRVSARDLHVRASAWLEQQGLRPEAIRHALAAEDVERAARLIELSWRVMDISFQSATWLRWVRALPDEIVANRPVLSLGYAWALLSEGAFEAAEIRLRDAERWLGQTPSEGEPRGSEPVVYDAHEFRMLGVTIPSARAYKAQALGDVRATIEHASEALAFLPEDDPLGRAIPNALLGLAHWASGNLEDAYGALADGMAGFETTGNLMAAISGTFGLADIRLAQGRLRGARHLYERALTLAQQDDPPIRGTATLYLGLSEIYREQGDSDAASTYLSKSEAQGARDVQKVYAYRHALAVAKVKEARGDFRGALEQLDEAERHQAQLHVPFVRPVSARKAQIWIKQGELAKAGAWSRERNVSVQDRLSYRLEFEHLTLARLLIAQHKRDGTERSIDEALGLLRRLYEAAQTGKRNGSVIEILIVQALAQRAKGNVSSALESLQQALRLAEPEGYVRVFVDEGTPVEDLLAKARSKGLTPNYIAKVCAAFETERLEQEEVSPTSIQPLDALTEPLSPRELEVLRLIAQGLSNREISTRLFRALDTVKGHNRNIFGKLQVQNRTEAVARARELGLL